MFEIFENVSKQKNKALRIFFLSVNLIFVLYVYFITIIIIIFQTI